MNRSRFPLLRFFLAAAAGSLWALSFPIPGVAGFAWVAPGLLLLATAGTNPGLAFRLAYAAGATHYLLSLSWLRHIPFPIGAYTGWFALSFFLALFPAAWVLACWRLAATFGIAGQTNAAAPEPAPDPATETDNPMRFISEVAHRLEAAPFWQSAAWFASCAAAWVAWEMVLARIFGGFPWNLLGASQYRMIPLIQIASATGVYGISFLVAWFSVALGGAIVLLIHAPKALQWRLFVAPPALAAIACTAIGFFSLQSRQPPPRSLSVALVQPGIPQTMIFDPETANERFETLLALTIEALKSKPNLLLWPEASLPGGLSEENFNRLLAALRESGTWMVLGSDEVIIDVDSEGRESIRAYNSAFLLEPRGTAVAGYRKRRLVIFGEYIPFGRWLPFLQHLAPIGEGFHAGKEPVAFHVPDHNITTSVLICFEDNFPHQAREHVVPGTSFLLNLTNDGWFGESAAQWQHLANSVFRAIENGVPLVRCANNGISCWIDPDGRIHSERIARGEKVYQPGYEIASVRFGPEAATIYHRVGDVFGWSCVAITGLMLARDAWSRRAAPRRNEDRTSA